MNLSVILDRTTTIRASIADIEYTILISIGLVIFVVFMFLRNVWATIIPSISVPLSLLGTFGVMYMLGYSVDNLSLMALAISTGFVVDDAIVVIENIARYLEMGMRPAMAALKGAREIAFTVLSMSVSLIAVFIPILLMGGILGRLFREFSVTLAIAIVISLVVSLTTTPSMCAKFLKPMTTRQKHGCFIGRSKQASTGFWRIPAFIAVGAAASSIDAARDDRNSMLERLPVCHRAEGIFPAAGYGLLQGNIQSARTGVSDRQRPARRSS